MAARHKMGGKVGIVELGQRGDVRSGHNEQMHWCLGVDISDGDHSIVGQDHVGWDFAARDSTEEAFRRDRGHEGDPSQVPGTAPVKLLRAVSGLGAVMLD
jgi:hypothetical protein